MGSSQSKVHPTTKTRKNKNNKSSRKVHPNTTTLSRNTTRARNNNETDAQRLKRLENATAKAKANIDRMGNLLTSPKASSVAISEEEMKRLLGINPEIPPEALSPYTPPLINRFSRRRAPRSEFKSFETLPLNPSPDGIEINEEDIYNRITDFRRKYDGTLPSPEELENFEIKFIEAEETRNKNLPILKALIADSKKKSINYKRGLNKTIEELNKNLLTAYIDYEAIKIYFNNTVKRSQNALLKSIVNSENLKKRGLGSVVYNTAVGGKYRRKNITRSKKHGLKSN